MNRRVKNHVLSILSFCNYGGITELFFSDAFLLPFSHGRTSKSCTRNKKSLLNKWALSLSEPVYQDDEYDEEIDFDTISDEQVLLACRAYLSRKHRLDWTERGKRRENAALHSRLSSNQSSIFDTNNLAVGYFWEDPSELSYLGKESLLPNLISDELMLDEDDGEQDELTQDVENEEEFVSSTGAREMSTISFISALKPPSPSGDSTSTLTLKGAEFTSFPNAPDSTHKIKSQTVKRFFDDPVWKARWYKQRWAGKTIADAESKKIAAKLKKLPASILRSEQLRSLEEEELAEAVQTYVQSNLRKSKAQQKRRRETPSPKKHTEIFYKQSVEQFNPLLNLSFNLEQLQLEEQRKRSEAAKKRYQSRIANQRANQKQVTSPVVLPAYSRIMSRDSDVMEAMKKLELTLTGNSTNLLKEDVKCVLQPKRLAGRRRLLTNLLSHHFDCRGKSIYSPQSAKYIFLQHATIEQIGDKIMFLIENKSSKS